MTELTHVDYPHTHGRLHDCPACENGPCYCIHEWRYSTPCLSQNCEHPETRAAKIGREHGRNAAGWWEQDAIGGRATGDVRPAALRTLSGIEDGDPEILDSLPGPDLSGQWADGYSSRDLYTELSVDGIDDDGSLCDAYEMAFSEAVHDEIARMCREVLA